MRYFISFSYFGKNYHGWQIQPKSPSVQAELTRALETLLRTEISLTGAGRTDTGVHAKQMFAHFDFPTAIPEPELCYKVNALLSDSIAVHDIFEVHPRAHARFDALSRTYEYHIHTSKNPFLTDFSFFLKRMPKLELMNEAAALLLQHTDFQCFSKTKTEVNNFNCAITKAVWKQNGDKLVFEITANRFLRNMVRAITGTLLDLGFERVTLADFQRILDSKNRSEAGTSVPAHGLYLTEVAYNFAELQPTSHLKTTATNES